MKPWQAAPPCARSDFARDETQLPTVDRDPAAHHVVSVGLVTLALGFVEACVHLERRPIPLRFAARFAVVNALPSAVWTTVAAPLVASASNLPLERLVAPASTQYGEANLPPRHANRIIAIQTLRSLRYAVASYGLVWSLWRWHETLQESCAKVIRTVQGASPPQAHAPAAPHERVVRVAPAGSFLSMATASKHGGHVLQVPWRVAQRGEAIDWSTIGLECVRDTGGGGGGGDSSSENALKVLELEIDRAHADCDALLIAKRTATGANSSVHTVAVVDAAASPVWHSSSNGVDVYYFALSGIVKFLRDHLAVGSGHEVVLIVGEGRDQLDEARLSQEREVMQLVRRALIHHCGISASVRMRHALSNEDEGHEGDFEEEERHVTTVVFAKTCDAAVKQLESIAGLVLISRTLVVIDESLSNRVPSLLLKAAGVLSIADSTDAVLQHIRTQLRFGSTPNEIQQSIFNEFGEQSALLARADSATDISRYI